MEPEQTKDAQGTAKKPSRVKNLLIGLGQGLLISAATASFVALSAFAGYGISQFNRRNETGKTGIAYEDFCSPLSRNDMVLTYGDSMRVYMERPYADGTVSYTGDIGLEGYFQEEFQVFNPDTGSIFYTDTSINGTHDGLVDMIVYVNIMNPAITYPEIIRLDRQKDYAANQQLFSDADAQFAKLKDDFSRLMKY